MGFQTILNSLFTQMVDANRKCGIKDLNCSMPKKNIKWLNEYVS